MPTTTWTWTSLGDALRALDAHRRAWAEYRTRTWEPTEDAAWDRWAAAGPSADDFGPPGAVAALAVMSRTEVSRLRLLATLGTERVEFATYDLDGFDADGLRLIRDWCRVLTAGPTPEDLDAVAAPFRPSDRRERGERRQGRRAALRVLPDPARDGHASPSARPSLRRLRRLPPHLHPLNDDADAVLVAPDHD